MARFGAFLAAYIIVGCSGLVGCEGLKFSRKLFSSKPRFHPQEGV